MLADLSICEERLQQTRLLEILEANLRLGLQRPTFEALRERYGEPRDCIGDYFIFAPIGGGGMGAVHLGYDPRLDRRVAIKVMFPDRSQIQFGYEALALGRLNSAYIVPVYEAGYDEHRQRLYIVMQLLEGVPLDEEIKAQREHAPFWELIAAMVPTIRALGEAHLSGIWHRDLKPSNLMVVRDSCGIRIVVLDFGLAKVCGKKASELPDWIYQNFICNNLELGHSDDIVGTPIYSSPEMHAALSVDHRSDIYSVGVILYQLIANRVPFTQTSYRQLKRAHINDPVPDLSQEVPENVADVVRKALEKKPEDRYQSAGLLADALERALIESRTLKTK